MNSDIKFWNDKVSSLLVKYENFFSSNLNGVRSNRISVDFLKNTNVNIHNGKIILAKIALLSNTPDLIVTAFEKSNVRPIIKALLELDIGLKLEKTNDKSIYFSLVPTTEELRRKLILKCKDELEKTKTLIRNNVRQKTFSEIKNSNYTSDEKKKIEKSLDKLIGDFNNTKLAEIYKKKVLELESL